MDVACPRAIPRSGSTVTQPQTLAVLAAPYSLRHGNHMGQAGPLGSAGFAVRLSTVQSGTRIAGVGLSCVSPKPGPKRARRDPHRQPDRLVTDTSRLKW